MSEFFAMGGYGLYVWGSFGAMALLMVAEVIIVRQQRHDMLTRLRRMERQRTAPPVSPEKESGK
ncbi:MAG: heme exporter protein CcmD [Gammaproteobacteria bacterium]|nr:heme exporter protein CcmD [Gammaproteobacteria bacterium]